MRFCLDEADAGCRASAPGEAACVDEDLAVVADRYPGAVVVDAARHFGFTWCKRITATTLRGKSTLQRKARMGGRPRGKIARDHLAASRARQAGRRLRSYRTKQQAATCSARPRACASSWAKAAKITVTVRCRGAALLGERLRRLTFSRHGLAATARHDMASRRGSVPVRLVSCLGGAGAFPRKSPSPLPESADGFARSPHMFFPNRAQMFQFLRRCFPDCAQGRRRGGRKGQTLQKLPCGDYSLTIK